MPEYDVNNEKGRKIQTLAQFTKRINDIVSDWGLDKGYQKPWYRGQSNASWDLVPSIYRAPHGNFYEREMLRDFKLLSRQFTKEHLPKNDFEWFFLMQHYGCPTRLLDWTESYLIALFFTVKEIANKNDGKVWLLNPSALNKHSIGSYSIPICELPELQKYLRGGGEYDRGIEAQFPVAIRPIKNSMRRLAQKGAFTIHGNCRSGFSELLSELEEIEFAIQIGSVIIDGAAKANILRELFRAGITHSLLMPDLEGVGQEVFYCNGEEETVKSLKSGRFPFEN